ncbi:MAG: metal-sulfur cluster assembly factor [Chloroflexi bacterium]|nr:MAG: metal-sulfur cluster assembly factor [Chloroflexota bacterium]
MSAEQPVPAGENGDGIDHDGDGAEERPSNDAVLEALSQVYDPEIGIDIVNLGLVYDTDVDDDGLLTVDMTLTSPYCPMGSIIQTQVHAVATQLPGVNDVRVNLVWSPPWDPRVMASDEAKLELGIY